MDTKTIQAFVQKWYPVAKQMEEQYGMPAEALLSQIALESKFGTSNFARTRNNMGGVGAYTKDPDQAMTFNSPEEAIAYQTRIQMAKAARPENQKLLDSQYGPTAPILADRKNPLETVFAAMQASPYSTDKPPAGSQPVPGTLYYADKLMARYNQMKPYITNAPQANPNGYELENRPQNAQHATLPPPPAATAQPTIAPLTGPFIRHDSSKLVDPNATMKYQNPQQQTSFVNASGRTAPSTGNTNGGLGSWILDRINSIFG